MGVIPESLQNEKDQFIKDIELEMENLIRQSKQKNEKGATPGTALKIHKSVSTHNLFEPKNESHQEKSSVIC